MVWLLGLEWLTVKGKTVLSGGVMFVVCSAFLTSLMESAGWVSSFWIVPVPTALAIVALVAPRSEERRVGKGCSAGSARASTVRGLLVSAGAGVSAVLRRLLAAWLPSLVAVPAV